MAVVEAIATTYLEVDATSVTFDLSSSPANTYEHLQLRLSMVDDRSSSNTDYVTVYFNGVTTAAQFAYHEMYATQSAAYESGSSGWQAIVNMACTTPVLAAQYTPRSLYGVAIVDIFDYRNPNKNTVFWSSGGAAGAYSGSSPASNVQFSSAMWDNTAAVTSIQLVPGSGTNFLQGSMFSIYGLKSS